MGIGPTLHIYKHLLLFPVVQNTFQISCYVGKEKKTKQNEKKLGVLTMEHIWFVKWHDTAAIVRWKAFILLGDTHTIVISIDGMSNCWDILVMTYSQVIALGGSIVSESKMQEHAQQAYVDSYFHDTNGNSAYRFGFIITKTY